MPFFAFDIMEDNHNHTCSCVNSKIAKRRKAQREAYARYVSTEAGKEAKRLANQRYREKRKQPKDTDDDTIMGNHSELSE